MEWYIPNHNNIWNGIDADFCILKQEADFLVAKDGKPWFLVEAKTSDTKLSPALSFYQKSTGAKHAFQVVFNLPYENVDCFHYTTPTVVPALTFLSQLV